MPDERSILAINAGSSSIKFALYGAEDPPKQRWRGKLDRIGVRGTTLAVRDVHRNDDDVTALGDLDHAAAGDVLVDWVVGRAGLASLVAVGHRIAHGGPDHRDPCVATAAVVERLRRVLPFAPEHLPAEIALIERFRERAAHVPQVLCFDTAFHRDMPRVATLLPLPRRLAGRGVRRYGFHGLSYAFLIDELARVAGRDAAMRRVVLAHLGNGASLAAVHHGTSIDTSMAFTPAAGVPMSTRSGDIDPGVVLYLARTEAMTPERFHRMVNHESGLLGVSETSSDVRDLLTREPHDARAAEALALFCYQVKKCVGAYAAALGGLDTVVFAGGIGENAPAIRARICEGLGFIGVALDDSANAANAAVISSAQSRVDVRVIATDEEIVIAKAVRRVLQSASAGRDAHAEDRR